MEARDRGWLWQKAIRAKYIKRDTVASVKGKFGDSPVWKAILKVKEYYLDGIKVVLNSGILARLWIDPLNNKPPLYSKFPLLFGMCSKQHITVSEWGAVNTGYFYRRRLHSPLMEQWVEMRSLVDSWNLSGPPDKIMCGLGAKKSFTTRSGYE